MQQGSAGEEPTEGDYGYVLLPQEDKPKMNDFLLEYATRIKQDIEIPYSDTLVDGLSIIDPGILDVLLGRQVWSAREEEKSAHFSPASGALPQDLSNLDKESVEFEVRLKVDESSCVEIVGFDKECNFLPGEATLLFNGAGEYVLSSAGASQGYLCTSMEDSANSKFLVIPRIASLDLASGGAQAITSYSTDKSFTVKTS